MPSHQLGVVYSVAIQRHARFTVHLVKQAEARAKLRLLSLGKKKRHNIVAARYFGRLIFNTLVQQ